MTTIHSTAIVDKNAILGKDVAIGPFCIVGPHVTLEDNVVLGPNVHISARTIVGTGTEISPFAVIGEPPQHRTYQGEDSKIIIGKNCKIREHVTIHPGTKIGCMETRVGDNCTLMVATHVAHDCILGNNVVMNNNATLGGHCIVEDFAIISGLSGVHQWVRIGKGAIIGGMSAVENDVIPYGSVFGNRARLGGLNLVGLKRRGVPREEIHSLRNAYRLLFATDGTLAERLEDVAELFKDNPLVMDIITFIRTDSTRSLCTP